MCVNGGGREKEKSENLFIILVFHVICKFESSAIHIICRIF